jgi:hypothetical protein
MATTRPTQPAWQRNALFQFFASLKLAVVLLAVLIVGAIAGTLYESTFDAKVARAYIYGAPWFNIWLVLLAANLTVSALSRWPWRQHHVAFLVTHLGIITLLTGALIGRTFGIEGTMTVFKGEPPNNKLLVDEHQLRVRDSDGIVKGYRAEFIHRPPTAQKPLDLGTLASGAHLSVIEYAPAVDSKLNPRPLQNGGAPALHFTIATQMMGQKLESWLLAGDQQHGAFNMGLANITLKRGDAPAASPAASPTTPGEVDIEESIFAFANAPDQQIGKSLKGGSTGAKLQFSKDMLTVNVAGKSATLEIASSLGKDVPVEGTPFVAHLDNYWPDFRIQDGKPTSISDQPNNPAVLVTLRGRAMPVEPARDAHSGAPEMPNGGDATANHLTLFVADDGAITYELASRKAGTSTGKLELNKPLPTGWADWQLTADRLLPHAEEWMDFNPAAQTAGKSEFPDGVRIRVQQGSQTFEQWVPAGWQITVPVSPQEIQVAYGWKQIALPIGLELREFEVQRNEGSDSPAGFKSTVRVSTPEGESATGQCWMNHPFNFPGAMWNTWTGLTFKMSQASWNPENLSQSTIQILRDPGWLLKWIGSLFIVSGVFMLFYVKKFRRPIGGASNKASRPQNREAVAAAVLVLLAATISGCASHSTPWTAIAKQQHPWGYYIGGVDTRWNSDGRTMTLLNELRYVDPKGDTWVAPAGSVVDGASIPRALWPFMGGPFEGKYRSASVLHDVSYDQKNRPPEECDRMFYNAMRCSGVSASEAKTMYWALLHFGRHWKFAVKKAKPAKVTDIAAHVAPSLAAPTSDSPRATAVNPDDVNAIRDWIRKNDPSLDQIETQAQQQQ